MYKLYKAKKDIPKWHIKKGDVVTISEHSYEENKDLFSPIKEKKAADVNGAEEQEDAS